MKTKAAEKIWFINERLYKVLVLPVNLEYFTKVPFLEVAAVGSPDLRRPWISIAQ